jgi:hypothetical protein
LVKRNAIAKGTAVAGLAVLVLAGAVGLFYYTMAPASPPSRGTSTTTSSNTSTTSTNSTQPAGGPTGGHCITNSAGQCQTPQGAWAEYLGYIPAGYVLSPHYPIAATYPCPSGMNPTQCKLFQASCGNGVCDPNESCATCAIDCGINGQLTCDPYTGRAGAPISVCQLGGQG